LNKLKVKRAVLPIAGHEGPEKEYSTLFLSSALEKDECSTSGPGYFIPLKRPILILQEAV